MSEIIRSIEKAQLRTDLPTFGIGDTVRVFVKVVEGSRERLQAFEGRGKVRRAKLYYLRSLQGKAAKIKEAKRV